MVTKDKLYIDKALNELELAKLLFKISNKKEEKNKNNLPESIVFYSQTITHSYYSIFYSAKAILLKNGIETKAPEEHKKTLEEFEEKLVKSGKLDIKLLELYKEVIIKASVLSNIFNKEKNKRSDFTYKTLSQAESEPAKTSLDNATLFFKHINALLEKEDK